PPRPAHKPAACPISNSHHTKGVFHCQPRRRFFLQKAAILNHSGGKIASRCFHFLKGVVL
ncbi:hypothetical protein, partial [Intestinimonas butyriciproducens]|uniref:hypothetical protein n=1 Tax=Intestinimonas butyriciproducens TaxID=1297617 RepID=UPI003AEF929A